MKSYYFLAAFATVFAFAFVIYFIFFADSSEDGIFPDIDDSGRQIFPQEIVFQPTGDEYDKMKFCTLDLSHCDEEASDELRESQTGQFAAHNNLIYTFCGRHGNIIQLDIYAKSNRVTILPRISPSSTNVTIDLAPAIAFYKGFFYTVFEKKLYQCSLNAAEPCQPPRDDPKYGNLGAIAFHMEYIYLLYRSELERCSNLNTCDKYSLKDFGERWCRSMAVSGEYLYVANCGTPQVLRYKTATMEREKLNIADGVMGSDDAQIYTYIFYKSIYFATENSRSASSSWKCDVADLKSCQKLCLSSYNFIIVYSSVEMLPEFSGEDIIYLVDNSEAELRVSKDGKLIDVKGRLFDTSDANFYNFDATNMSSGMKAAIFVMDNTGSIYASNNYAHDSYHHSSLMAGKPVSSAGLLQVKAGVIEYASSSSRHYNVPAKIAEQFLDSLSRQGYTASAVNMEHKMNH